MNTARKHLWILLTPFVLFYLGVLCNILVISANGGMPVVVPETMDPKHITYPGLIIDHVHIVARSTDHLWYLIDWIYLPWSGVASVGDLFLWLGDWLTVPGIAAYFALVLCS